MMKEEKGLVAPGEIFIGMSEADIELLRQKADARDRFRRYAEKTEQWRRGLIKHPILYGFCGEHALCVFLRRAELRLSVDDRLLRKGDGGTDVLAAGLACQVKTNRTGNANLIRRVDDKKRLIPLSCDLFVFARMSSAPLGVYLKGWIWSREASGNDLSRIRKSPIATHFNLVIDPKTLEPMNRLLVEVRSRRAA